MPLDKRRKHSQRVAEHHPKISNETLTNPLLLASPALLLDVGVCDGVRRLSRRVMEGVGHSLLFIDHPGPNELDVQTPVR